MVSLRSLGMLALAVTVTIPFATPTRAELVEEIVAWVNGDIVTKSDYDAEDQVRVAEIYRQFSGSELDAKLKEARDNLLMEMIDRKILVHHAKALGYDLGDMEDVFYEGFKDNQMAQQGITSDEEFERVLVQQGLTEKEIKRTLVEMYAPEEVIRFEVTSRVSVGETEIQEYYDANPENFRVPAQVTLREIVLLAEDDAAKQERRALAEETLRRVSSADSGENYEDVVLELSEAGTRDAGGILGPIEIADLSELLAEAASSVAVGDVSGILEAPYGFHIVKIESRTDEHLQPLDDVREKVRRYLEDRKYRDELQLFLEKARSNSEWCVKPKYATLVPTSVPTSCETL